MASKGYGEGYINEDTKKMRGFLSGVVITEKPDVKWEDISGLESAKKSLKPLYYQPVFHNFLQGNGDH